ncbi:MAG TPA: hemolysin family protein [Blastocatellia bacterium]|nr:hemolysin family protein [Blastocatellia bacterium]
MAIELTGAGVALLVLVFLSTIESAYESLSEVSLRVMAGEHEDSPRAGFFRRLLDDRRRFELVLIFGTQLSIAAIAIFALDLVQRLDVRQPLAVAFLVVILIIAVFRQLLPRMVCQNNPEGVFWMLLPIFRIFYGPLSLLVAPISALLEKAKRPEEETQHAQEEDEEETMEEIQAFLDVGEEEGIIEESEGELIQSIIEFRDTLVGEVMRPRPQIVAIEENATVADARRLIIESKYSRIPVYRGQIDDIQGIIYVRDLLLYCEDDKSQTPLKECLRPAYFVPESKSIRELLEEMQKAKVQISVVIDEYGGVAGLVTIEDIIEEILGEIEDEDRAGASDEVTRLEDGSHLVDGSAEIRKVELLYDKEIVSDDFTTVAGLIISEMGHVPAPGEVLEYKGLRFEIVDSEGKRVNRVRISAIEDPAPGDGTPGTAGE